MEIVLAEIERADKEMNENGIVAIGEINTECFFDIIAILSQPGSGTRGRGALPANRQKIKILQGHIGWSVGNNDPPVTFHVALIGRGHGDMQDAAAIVCRSPDCNGLSKTISRQTDDK